jgi:cell division septation protein DedD
MTENSPKNMTDENKAVVEKKRKGSGFWITLICFSSIWMFVFGVLVGRGTVPVQVDIEKLQNELISLKASVLRKEKEKLEAHSRGIKESAGLDFFDELKQADGFRAPQTAPATPPTVPPLQRPDIATPPQTIEKPPPLATIPPETLPNKTPAQAKPGDKQPDGKNVKTEENQPQTRWAIQVASMKDAAAADKMVEQLKQKGYPAYRFGAAVPGKGVWHRIRVGPFKDKTDAEKKLIRLKNDNFSAIMVSP